jgi:hypothetical protein
MNINLKEIPIFCFSGKNQDRKNKIRSVIKKLDLEPNTEYIDCILSKNTAEGNRKTFLKILERALDIKGPCLILEDDAHPSSNYCDTLYFPDDSDAVYLGTGANFLNKNWMDKSLLYDVVWDGDIDVQPVDSFESLYRIKNMLTSHAILFVSKEYKEMCYNILKYNINNYLHTDCVFAHLMNYHNIYAYKKPMFYQDCYKDNPPAYFTTYIPLEDFISGRIKKETIQTNKNGVRE